MKQQGIWHPRLSEIVASCGHGDLLVVADAGLPIPKGVEVVDLIYKSGAPSVDSVVGVILEELVVESVVIALESKLDQLKNIIEKISEFPVEKISHEDFKKISSSAKAIVRTGEVIPFANVMLKAGVNF